MGFYQKYILPKRLDTAMSATQIEKLRSGVADSASGIVLEIGSGSGSNLPFYKNISQLYALEPSQELINLAKQRAKNLPFAIQFLNTPAENIPLPDNSVDSVVSTWVLCSVAEPEKVLEEIKRVLRPGGRFIFIDHGISPNPLIAFLQYISTPVTKYLAGNCHLNRDIKQIISNADFTVQKIEQSHEITKPLMYNTKGITLLSS